MTRLLRDLQAPGSELIETHISWVLLGDGDVWKLKKPVALGFLDFSDVEKRRLACEAEVRLNRRLAPGVYLGCVPVTIGADGCHRFGGSGEPVDWAVHMRRLADDDRADLRLADDRLGAADLERIANRLAAFHDAARCDEETARYGTIEAIGTNVRENFEQTRAAIHQYVDPRQAEEIEAWQSRYLERHAERFEHRVASGRVRDGHGDLRLEHVYLGAGDEVSIIDCIEFNRRFRYADVCADVAFLAMDLAWRGRPDLAERFLAFYARAANDFDLYLLVDFYESYRAFVRGKIATLLATDLGIPASVRQIASSEARRYFMLSLAAERRQLLPPRVIAVGGLIASGKSTLAEALAAELAAPVVDADRTRKSLLGVLPTTPVDDPAWQGAYTPEATREVYGELVRRAESVLQSGRTVVLDASFRSRQERIAARQLAESYSVPFHFVECRVPTEVCRQRLRQRAERRGVSDGRLEIFDDFAASWQAVDELAEAEHLMIDTSKPLVANLAELRRRFGAWPAPRPTDRPALLSTH